jgi:hypothetical protein
MDPQFEELARKVATEVIEQLSVKLEEQLTRQLDGFENRLKGIMQADHESVRDVLNGAAQGHARTLASIHQTLDRLEKIVDSKFGDHDSILDQHNQRISTLEKTEATS